MRFSPRKAAALAEVSLFDDCADFARRLCYLHVCKRAGPRCCEDGVYCAAGVFNSLACKSIKFKPACLEFDNNRCLHGVIGFLLQCQESAPAQVKDVL